MPQGGSTTSRMPLFTWKPLNGPAELLRRRRQGRSSQTSWTSASRNTRPTRLAPGPNAEDIPRRDDLLLLGGDAREGRDRRQRQHDHPAREPAHFQKALDTAVAGDAGPGADVTTQPMFRWTPTRQPASIACKWRRTDVQQPARRRDHHLNGLHADHLSRRHALYWRVRANDENPVGLTWSAIRNFRRRLPAPVPNADNPKGASFRPYRGATGRGPPRTTLGRPARRRRRT